MLAKVVNFLKDNAFLHISKMVDSGFKLLTGFEHVYLDSRQAEIYILVDKDDAFLPAEIEEYETQISGFITLFANDILAYNVNLILISPIGLYSARQNTHTTDIDLINHYERDKYICRKIFLDSTAKGRHELDELSILPFVKVSFEDWENNQDQDEHTLLEIFKNNESLLKELTKNQPEISIEKIQNMLGHVGEDKGERDE